MDKHFIHLVPLLLFTALATIAAGLMVGSAGLMINFNAVGAIAPMVLTAFIVISLGTLISLLHLGRKERFMRAIFGIRHSWLSREVVMASILAASTGVAYLLVLTGGGRELFIFALAVSAVSGLFLSVTIGMVYNLTGRKTWNGITNRWAPVISALLLGTGSLLIFSLQTRFLRIFLILWVVDFLFAVGRGAVFFKAKKNDTRFVFPQLSALAGTGHAIRIVFSILMLIAGLSSFKPAIIGMVVGTILLDRYSLYTGTIDVSPGSEIAQEKSTRMQETINHGLD